MSQYNITPKKVEPGLLLAAEAVRELQFDFAIIELSLLSERVLFKASDVKASTELNAISEKLRAHGIERDNVLVTPKRLGRGSGFSSRKGVQEIADASPANLGALIGLSVSSPSLREKAESISYELHDAGLETALDAYRLAKNCEIRVQVSALFELQRSTNSDDGAQQ